MNTVIYTNQNLTSKPNTILSRSCDKFSSTSSKIFRTEEEIIQHSQKLFNDAERLKLNKERLAKEYLSQKYPFKPEIADKNKPNIYNFFFRLQKWVDKRNEKYEEDMEKINYDSNTGLRLFSPNINEKSNSVLNFY